jgi:acetyl esterase/lipase
MNTVFGFGGDLCAGLLIVAALGLVAVAARGTRPRRRRLLCWAALAPMVVLMLVGAVLGVAGSAAGSIGNGQVRTVEYCHPGGIPLAMDVYPPPRRGGRPAPVALYVHGGGFLLGDRKASGTGSALANSSGALFVPIRDQLNALGFAVASIDYRLAPEAPWPAPITDAKCAVRFLRAHAGGLGVDPNRIAVWGSSAGGTLAALLGTAGPSAGFDVGEYLDRSSSVQAVVTMFGPSDLARCGGAGAFTRAALRLALGTSARTRRAASPETYVAPGDPPFLLLHGDRDALQWQSVEFAARLRSVGVAATYIPVRGTGHTLNTPNQHPTPRQLISTIATFLTTALRAP